MAHQPNSATNAFVGQLFSSNGQAEQAEQTIQMPELALRCAQFFHSLSQYCLYFYKNYNRQADIHKTKLIKKTNKPKKTKYDSKKRNSQDKKNRIQIGQGEPEPPKKPLTAYILYFQDKKPSFAEKFPTLSLSELTKLIAKDWKDLKQEEKKPYLDRATDDRKRYETQMNEFKRKYRLGEQNRLEKDFMVEEIKASQVLEQKDQQIPLEIEDDIKAVSLLNEAQLESKNERLDENAEEGADDEANAEEGMNFEYEGDNEEECFEEDGDSQSENDEADENDLEASEEVKINEE